MVPYSKEESREIWQYNAQFWDDAMGDDSNAFHRQVVRPRVSELMQIQPEEFVLDIACGNGNYSAYMAARGARVVAFDYSEKMIALARKRQKAFAERIEFCVADATDYESLIALKRERPFAKAVCNMAVMDITDIRPLFRCISDLLAEDGWFVFATQHPCFVTLTERYRTPHSYYGDAISGQPKAQCYYHRSMQEIFHLCFQTGFVIDGFYEESYGDKEVPDIIIVRARKNRKGNL